MAVSLMDAKITVKLDLEESEKKLSTVEERTKKQRAEEEKTERREKDAAQRGKRKPGARGGIGVFGGVGVAGLAAKFRGLAPVAIAVAALEAADRLEAKLEALGISKETQGAAFGTSDFIMRKLFGKGWVDLWRGGKEELTALKGAVDDTKAMVRASAFGGLQITPETAAEFFGQSQRQRRDQARLKRNIRLTGDFIGTRALKDLAARTGEGMWK